MLTGGVWPVHPQPKEDEMLSSWIARVARGNGNKLHTFCRIGMGEVNIWTRDIDKLADREFVAMFAAKCGTHIERAWPTTLRSLEGVLVERIVNSGSTPLILPLGVYHRTRRRFGLQYCPVCLAASPHYRRRWRLATSVTCTLHRCRLHDRCPRCHSQVMFHRRDFFDRNVADKELLSKCWKCRFDLADSSPNQADERILALQKEVETTLEEGWALIPEFGKVHSLAFFAGLRQLIKIAILEPTCRRRFAEIGLEPITINQTRREIEYLDTISRYRGMERVASWWADWPESLIAVCKQAKIGVSYIFKDFAAAPWWFVSQLRWRLHGGLPIFWKNRKRDSPN